VLASGLLAACNATAPREHAQRPKAGRWSMDLELNGEHLPVHLEVVPVDSASWWLQVINGDEVITVKDIEQRGDSLFIRMPLFDSEFRAVLHDPEHMSGRWFNHLRGPDHSMPFEAHAGHQPRPTADSSTMGGQWRVRFSPGAEDGYDAIGIFELRANGQATGTFLTETGDYRYLDGWMQDDSLLLGGFDGSHAFLFQAARQGDSLVGRFRSGIHWEEPWVGVRDPGFKLRDPDSLTFLREGHGMIDFRFPDLQGRLVSPNDPQYKGKALLVQVMGSWCPNCVDETRLLNELYARYHAAGLEVLAVAFEKHRDPDRAKQALERYQHTLEVPYPILYAGSADKAEAAARMPFLNHVMSYPTCILVDRRGKVRRIRTGIYGPGTGAHYAQYKRSLTRYVEELLDEDPVATLP
jgi:thiol-disulfide isomerase/thioredoxin